MKKFIVETLAGAVVVEAESADAIKANLAARGIEADVRDPKEGEADGCYTVPADHITG